MTKHFCDICGKEVKEISTIATVTDSMIFFTDLTISKNGKYLDICDGCKNELKEWIRNKKKDGEE